VYSVVSKQLEQLCDQCHHLLYGEDAPHFEIDGGISLAYHVATELPLDTGMRQELLEVRSESERQAFLVAHLQDWYPQLQRRERVRGKAAGNGHSKI
jgi:hypothetical protein